MIYHLTFLFYTKTTIHLSTSVHLVNPLCVGFFQILNTCTLNSVLILQQKMLIFKCLLLYDTCMQFQAPFLRNQKHCRLGRTPPSWGDFCHQLRTQLTEQQRWQNQFPLPLYQTCPHLAWDETQGNIYKV